MKNILNGVDLKKNDEVSVSGTHYVVCRTSSDYTLLEKKEIVLDGEDPIHYVLDWEAHTIKSIDLGVSFVCDILMQGNGDEIIFNDLSSGDMDDFCLEVGMFNNVKLIN